MKNYLDLTGKVALVTGASSGIGAATAVLLAELGAKVAIGYFHNPEGAGQTREAIAAAGGSAIAIRADARRLEGNRAMVAAAVDAFGPIDILVNNAGAMVARLPLAEITEEVWDEIFDLNLKSAVFCSQEVAPSMIERKTGAIVNVVSIAAHNGGGPGAGPYASAKAGLVAITKSIANFFT